MSNIATPESTANLRVLVDAAGDCLDVFEPYVRVVKRHRAKARADSGDEIVTTLVPPAGAALDDVEADVRVAGRKASADYDAACSISLADPPSEHMHPAWPQASAVNELLDRGYTLEHEGRAVSDAAARFYAGGRYPALS